jgi:hypothetical protein
MHFYSVFTRRTKNKEGGGLNSVTPLDIGMGVGEKESSQIK